MAAKNGNHFEVRRAASLSSSLLPFKQRTLRTQLSSDGRTVTSLKVGERGVQTLEVWDTGKGQVCRVPMQEGTEVTGFLQLRLGTTNLLFVCCTCAPDTGASQGGAHVSQMHGYEINGDGQTSDFWLRMSMQTESDTHPADIYFSNDTLFINMS